MFEQKYCNKVVFDSARVLMALGVFFCHLFEQFNSLFGYFFVSVFFFFSGYGMEKTFSRLRSLKRLVPYLVTFSFAAVLYYFVYGDWFFPGAWFFVSYFSLMVVYRFFAARYFVFVFAFLLFELFFVYLQFSCSYWISPFGFLMGFCVARTRSFFSWIECFVLFSIGLLIFYTHEILFLLFWVPLFIRLSLYLSSFFFFLCPFSLISYPFFVFHTFVLGFFGATWTLGGSFSFAGSLFGFLLSLLFAFFLWRFVPFFSKKR